MTYICVSSRGMYMLSIKLHDKTKYYELRQASLGHAAVTLVSPQHMVGETYTHVH